MDEYFRVRTAAMSPQEIDLVRSTWSAALATPELLRTTIGSRLPGDHREARAEWILEAITQLSTALDRPTRFEAIAEGFMACRDRVTIADLETERDALLDTLAELVGPLSDVTTRAWDLAIGLFADIVAAIGLDPFAAPPPVAQTPTRPESPHDRP